MTGAPTKRSVDLRKRNKTALRAQLVFSILLGVIGFAAITILAVNVTRDLRLLNSASSDNVQWTLSQTEVEFLEFERTLWHFRQGTTPDLAELRREFDIFYSRITTLREASIYAPVRGLPDFRQSLEELRIFLDEGAALIDSDDATLLAALPQLQTRASDLRSSVRRLSNSGLNYFARESDRRRESISVTLNWLAIGVTILLATLLLLALYLGRLNRLNVKRSKEALQASKRMNIVTGTALDAVIVADGEGRILDFNAAAEQIFGHDAKRAIGANLGTLIVPDNYRAAHEAGMARMRTGGERRVVGKGRIKLEAMRANGELFPVEFAIQTAETEDGEIFIAFLRDISHRVAAEQELVAARDRALADEKAKTDFLATMSHEIRTPLNGLLGNLTLLRDTRLSGKQARYIKNMETSGKLLMSHISDVLDITKYDAGKLQLRPVDMNIRTLLQDIVDNQSGTASANNTTLKWGWSGAPVHRIHADKERIQHVLMNIIGNAVKFTSDGQITVEISATAQAEGHLLEINVLDTGIGIPASLLEHIFGDFMTGDNSYDRDVGGTGLGLGIARRFVSAMGGAINVESTEGQGSTFQISLPVETVRAPDQDLADTDQTGGDVSYDVLLVEDNEINRVVAREMLQAQGHHVTEAHNGQAAVDVTAARHFDLIFMDISMPVMDGRKATRAIRAGGGPCRDTPIVALTANAMAEEQEAFLSDGMNDILTKPLSREALIKVLAHYAGKAVNTAPPQVPETENPHLSQLTEMLGPEGAQNIVNRFVTEVEAVMQVFGNAEAHGMDELGRHAHRIAGSAATFGLMEMRAALIVIERAALEKDAARLEDALHALPAVWDAARPALEIR